MILCSDDTSSQYSYLVSNLHLSDINPLNCGWHQREKGGFFGPAIRDHYILHYVLSGHGLFSCNGKEYNLDKNSIFLIKPHDLIYYKADDEDPWAYAWIGFNGNYCDKILNESGFGDHNYTIYAPELFDILNKIRHHSIQEPINTSLLCSILYEIFAVLQTKLKPTLYKPSPQIYCEHAKDFMNANYATKISIEGIAQILGINRRYFSRIFTKLCGLTPQQYLVNLRLSKAAELLLTNQYTITEAAKSAGYDDLYNFSKMFKNKYAVSPTEYIKKRNIKQGDAG